MSADNWATCPRCLKRAQRAYDAKAAEVYASYGKVPVAEFEQARDALKSPQPTDFDTFREDYEIYGARDGAVTVSYGGSCGTCGLSLSFKETHPLEGVDD